MAMIGVSIVLSMFAILKHWKFHDWVYFFSCNTQITTYMYYRKREIFIVFTFKWFIVYVGK
jgi:hypothetical protein